MSIEASRETNRKTLMRWIARCTFLALLVATPVVVLLIADELRLDALSAQWQHVRAGQTKQEVIGLLGKPNHIYPAEKNTLRLGPENETWAYGKRFFRLRHEPPFIIPKVLDIDLFNPGRDTFSLEFDTKGFVIGKHAPSDNPERAISNNAANGDFVGSLIATRI